jgi:cell division septation protein DedD
MSIFDVTSASRTDAIEEERLYPDLEERIEPSEPPAAAVMTEAPEPHMSASVAAARYVIQLGALPSRDSAQREWRRIESRHAELVRDRSPTIIPVELDVQAGTVFRLRTGPFAGLTQAHALCAEFRSQKQDCFVAKAKNPS